VAPKWWPRDGRDMAFIRRGPSAVDSVMWKDLAVYIWADVRGAGARAGWTSLFTVVVVVVTTGACLTWLRLFRSGAAAAATVMYGGAIHCFTGATLDPRHPHSFLFDRRSSLRPLQLNPDWKKQRVRAMHWWMEFNDRDVALLVATERPIRFPSRKNGFEPVAIIPGPNNEGYWELLKRFLCV